MTAPVLDPTAEFFQILAGLRKFSAKFTPKIANLAKLREKNLKIWLIYGRMSEL